MASGLAYGKVAVSGDTNVSAEGVGVFTPTTAGFGASKTNLGFSVGGVEGSVLASTLVAKLGDSTGNRAICSLDGAAFVLPAGRFAFAADMAATAPSPAPAPDLLG
jgi:hypothetical protein